jgi:hypothetical protein
MLPHMIKISPGMPILLTSSWFNSLGNALIFVSHQHLCKSLPGRTDSLIGKWKSTWRAEVEHKPSCWRELRRCIRYHGGGIVLIKHDEMTRHIPTPPAGTSSRIEVVSSKMIGAALGVLHSSTDNKTGKIRRFPSAYILGLFLVRSTYYQHPKEVIRASSAMQLYWSRSILLGPLLFKLKNWLLLLQRWRRHRCVYEKREIEFSGGADKSHLKSRWH